MKQPTFKSPWCILQEKPMSMLPQLCDLGPTNLEKKFPDHRFSVEVTDRMFSRLQTSKQRYHSSYKGKDKKQKQPIRKDLWDYNKGGQDNNAKMVEKFSPNVNKVEVSKIIKIRPLSSGTETAWDGSMEVEKCESGFAIQIICLNTFLKSGSGGAGGEMWWEALLYRQFACVNHKEFLLRS